MSSPPSAAGSRRAALSGPVLGILLMILGIFLFSLNDALGKWLVGTYSVSMVLLFRSIAALVLLAPFVHRDGGIRGLMAAPRPWVQLARVALATLEVGFFYWSVRYLPLADVMTYYLAGPIYVAALSALVLKERIDARRWAAILVGFVGVIIVLKPSAASLTPPAFVAITGSFVFAVLMLVTRQLRGTKDSTLLAFTTTAAMMAGAVTAPFAWVTPTLRDFGLLSLVGVVALVASLCVNRSLKLAPASVVVPYQYTMILWAGLFGYVFFGDAPKLNLIIGALIIVAAGLYIFLREQKDAKAGSGETVAEEVGQTMSAQP
ncbi:DMT family transporter [Kaistia geumhonensis]|nr:DMT family transporter [Kaistia geumhonensis]MCX5477909.1 DMT family transporter [Kaistia geumhonensis]